jgi:Lrp/AsnC family leucine-responsive transcriptional regulator
MAPSAVLERIRKLGQQGFIDGYEVRLNPDKFGRSLVAFIQVSVDADADHDRVGDALTRIDGVQDVHFTTGDDAYLLKLRVSNPRALDALVRKQIAGIPGVRSTRTTLALNTLKETWRIPIDLPEVKTT